MRYLVRWQLTRNNPTAYKTQVDVIVSCFIPLLENKSFLEKKYRFYITKVWRTDVRLAVYVEDQNLKGLADLVGTYVNNLVLHPYDPDEQNGGWQNNNNGWNGQPIEEPQYDDCEKRFYQEYLQDIASISIDLHRGDITTAIRQMQSIASDQADARSALDAYFRQHSRWYASKNSKALDEFWGQCGFGFRGSGTDGQHFVYNAIVGLDLRAIHRNNLTEVVDSIVMALR